MFLLNCTAMYLLEKSKGKNQSDSLCFRKFSLKNLRCQKTPLLKVFVSKSLCFRKSPILPKINISENLLIIQFIFPVILIGYELCEVTPSPANNRLHIRILMIKIIAKQKILRIAIVDKHQELWIDGAAKPWNSWSTQNHGTRGARKTMELWSTQNHLTSCNNC